MKKTINCSGTTSPNTVYTSRLNSIIYPSKLYRDYFEFIYEYCGKNELSSCIKGSFKTNEAMMYSDIDLSIIGDISGKNIKEILFGRYEPIFIGKSINPKGLLIIFYSNNLNVDIGFKKSLTKEEAEDELFLNCLQSKFYASEKMKLIEVDGLVNIEYNSEDIFKLFVKGYTKLLQGKNNKSLIFLNEIIELLGEKYNLSVKKENDLKSSYLVISSLIIENDLLHSEKLNDFIVTLISRRVTAANTAYTSAP